MTRDKSILEIVFHARGGQGAKTAAEIIAQAAHHEGKFVQAFPSFGPERSGAPAQTFVRISDIPIRTHEPVVNPDALVFLDETILYSKVRELRADSGSVLIINSKKTPEEWKKIIIDSGNQEFRGTIHVVDANGISLEIVGQPRPNTVALGKILQITKVVSLDKVIDEFKKIFEPKLGMELTIKNVQAIEKAYASV